MQTTIRTIATLLWLLALLCGAASAQNVFIESQLCRNGYCQRGESSGTIIHSEAGWSYVLTVAHGNGEPGETLTVCGSEADIIARDPQIDLSLLRFRFATDLVATIGNDLQPGQQAWLFTFRGRKADRKAVTVIDRQWVTGVARQGDSGGSVHAARRTIGGVVVGVTENRTYVVPASVCRRFVAANLPQWKASADAGQPAAAESVPSTQGTVQDEPQQPAAGEIKRYERTDQQAQPPPAQSQSGSAEKPESPGTPVRTAEPAGTPSGDTDAAVGPAPAADRLERVGDAAESFLSDPLVQAGIWAAVGVATGGTGLAAKPYVGAAWAVICAERRRRKKKKAGHSSAAAPDPPAAQEASGDSPEGFPELRLHDRDTTEAREHLRLGQLEGRNPLLDSLMGMSFDDVLQRDLDNPEMPPELQQYARALRDEVRQRIDAAAPLSTGKPYSDSWRGTNATG